MLSVRYTKIMIALFLASLGLITAFNNITDYGTNFKAVQHVLSMDTTFANNTMRYRAITAPWLHTFFYLVIILCELLMGLCFLIGAIQLYRSRYAEDFNQRKRYIYIGATIGLFVWLFCFMIIGGEWFSMWQAKQWNSQQATFRNYMTVLVGTMFIHMKDET
jgi:predicted small integral membrane protein